MDVKKLEVKKRIKKMAHTTYSQVNLVCETPPYQSAPFVTKRTIGIYVFKKNVLNALIDVRNSHLENGASPNDVFEITLTPLMRIIAEDSYSTRERATFRRKTSEVVAATMLSLWGNGIGSNAHKVRVEKPTKFYARFYESEPTIVLLDEYFLDLLTDVGHIKEGADPNTLLTNAEEHLPVVKVSTKFLKED